jgi:molybdopterin-containing oxidoreductase family iron-sulfur binding subunit
MADIDATTLPLEPELDPDKVYPNPRDPGETVDRRRFLGVVGASAAVAGVAGCSPRFAPLGEIVPYVQPPEQYTPGVPLHFATAMEMNGVGIGLLATSREGRPTKIEGNPEHPSSLGSSDLFSQGSLLDLYDPDRSKQVRHRQGPATWEEAFTTLRHALEKQRSAGGAGVRILSGACSSPTLAGLMGELLKHYPRARWTQYEPGGRDAILQGARRAFGQPLQPVYDFSKADVVLSLACDFLACEPGTVRYQRDFAERRRVRHDGKGGITADRMNRLYTIETCLTGTGVSSDHRLALKPSEIEAFARVLASEMKVPHAPPPDGLSEEARAWIVPLARDLAAHRQRSIVLVGECLSPSTHALGFAINEALGNIGQTLHFIAPAIEPGGSSQSLSDLVREMEAGQVELLLILGCNPLYTSPGDLPFGEALEKVTLSAHLGLQFDETAVVCDWHLPQAHYLECWGDVRGHDGKPALQQPLIEPLYDGRSAIELLAGILGTTERRGREVVREHWRAVRGKPENFDDLWEESVQKGVIDEPGSRVREVKIATDWASHPGTSTDGYGSLELVFLPDPTLHDGRFANNGWLQELPKPATKLTWGNAALMSPATARSVAIEPLLYPHGGQHGGVETRMVELNYRGRKVSAPVFVVDGHADGAVTVFLGHGRTMAGSVGNGVGFDAYQLRTSDAPGHGKGLELVPRPESFAVACTQVHHSMHDKEPIHHSTAADYLREPRNFTPALQKEADKAAATALSNSEPPPAEERDRRLYPLSLNPGWSNPGHKWGMSIDLSTCTGCSACVIACVAENNIPVVGKDQVLRAREMHWIRVDRYTVEGRNYFQPLPCMQCENAPCEYVCPVGATLHSHDGLNDMIYNRCVGTRYCSNNCPYKVRRFNFLAYADFTTESFKPMRNPDVSVRSRGVMEKCTYCVQRIRGAESAAIQKHSTIPEGSLQTACQQACPSRAIVFGNLNDGKAEVNRWKAEPHDYVVLGELNTRPRTSYLSAIRNPNPDMPKGT